MISSSSTATSREASPSTARGGNDNVEVFDDDTTANQFWLITSTVMTRSEFSVSYANIETLALTTGSGNDTVDVESLPAATVSVANGGGNDIWDVTTNAKALPSVVDPLSFNAIAGSASLTLDNSASSSISLTTITATSINIGAGINYSGIGTLTYNLSNFSSVVYFTSTNSSTAYVINGGEWKRCRGTGAGRSDQRTEHPRVR